MFYLLAVLSMSIFYTVYLYSIVVGGLYLFNLFILFIGAASTALEGDEGGVKHFVRLLKNVKQNIPYGFKKDFVSIINVYVRVYKKK